MAQFRVLSSDSHVVEPPNLWLDRMDPSHGDAIPRVVAAEEADLWFINNAPVPDSEPVRFAQAGQRFEKPVGLGLRGSFQDVPLGGYDPHAAVREMGVDSVNGGVVYPSFGLVLYAVPDADILRPIFAAYNDWLAEFCGVYPGHLKGIAMIITDGDIPAAIAELRRAAGLGLGGAMISVYPVHGQSYDQPEYEPFWAAAEELDMPLSLHVATQRPLAPGLGLPTESFTTAPGRTNNDYWPRMSMSYMLFSGVFERHPGLKVVNVEHELGWIPYFLFRMDVNYLNNVNLAPYRFKNDAVPSDFMRTNVFHSFQEDHLGIRFRDLIGVDNLLWGSDYPHLESTFPKSADILDRILEGVPDDERAKIVGGNTARVYKFPVS